MAGTQPVAELNEGFSSPGATARPWTEVAAVLDRAGITVNKNAIPFDTSSPFKPGGIRVGTPAVTTRGMREEEMLEIADLIAEALQHRDDDVVLERVRGKVRELTRRFPLPS